MSTTHQHACITRTTTRTHWCVLIERVLLYDRFYRTYGRVASSGREKSSMYILATRNSYHTVRKGFTYRTIPRSTSSSPIHRLSGGNRNPTLSWDAAPARARVRRLRSPPPLLHVISLTARRTGPARPPHRRPLRRPPRRPLPRQTRPATGRPKRRRGGSSSSSESSSRLVSF